MTTSQRITLNEYKKLNTINDAAKAILIVLKTFNKTEVQEVLPIILGMVEKHQKENVYPELNEPESIFENSILESEYKKFPEKIVVIIETSNNPHGDWALTVCDKDEQLGQYFYDSKEDAQKDGDKLEEFCNVTFE